MVLSFACFFACGDSTATPDGEWGTVFTKETAYAKAQELGYEGSIEDFMADIKGEVGLGIKSLSVVNGELIVTYTDDSTANCGFIDSVTEKSEYQIYKEKYGYEGTLEEWVDDLVFGRLTAHITFEITFNSNGGNYTPAKQTLKYGEKLTEPTEPTKEGFDFGGWYYYDDYSAGIWDFDNEVTSQITVYAVWNQQVVKVENYIANDYVLDYQVLESSKFYIDYEGVAPDVVLYGEAGASGSDLYQPYWVIVDNKIEIEIEGDMMGTKGTKMLKYVIGNCEYTTYLTINPITENYFIIDGTEGSFKLDIANIESAKFNGTDVASVTGISKEATGLTFTKELLATKLGLNKVEIKTASKNYVLAIACVTKEELRQPITFEDGKMSPFISVFGDDYEVVKGSDIADTTIREKYTGGYKYYYGTDLTNTFNNQYCLEIDHRAGSYESLRMYISSFYMKERVACMSTLTADVYAWPGDAGAKAINGEGSTLGFLTGGDNKLTIRTIKTNTDNAVVDGYCNVGGKDLASTAFTYFGFYHISQVNRTVVSLEAYNMCIDATSGDILVDYVTVCYRDANENYKIYIDDVFGCCATYSGNVASLPLPAKLA